MSGKVGFKSAEIVVESEEEEEEEEVEGKNDLESKQSKQIKRKAPLHAKGSAKRVRITSEEPAARESAKKSSRKSVPATATTTSSESSSDVSSSSESDESESEEASPVPQTSNGTREMPPSPTHDIASLPTAPFEPPTGFEPLPTSAERPHSETSRLFDPSSLSSKQVWHITAPAGLPISALTSLDLARLNGRDTLITHKGDSYSIADNAVGSTALLLPHGNGYKPLKGGFAKVLHMTQIPGVKPEKARDGNGKSLRTVPLAKEVRQQPEGLRTRYWPPGFEAGVIGVQEDSEEEL